MALGFPGETEPELAKSVDSMEWHPPGQIEAQVAFLQAHGVCEAVMIGKLPKLRLVTDLSRLRLDPRALGMLGRLRARNDDAILGAIADELLAEGIVLCPQTELLPDWVAEEGVLGAVQPTDAQRRDVAFAWPVAKALGGVDVGQTVVVHDRAVIALEAIEGTDETIRRGARLCGPGAVVLKVAKPGQDPRFDVPAIGPDTLDALAQGHGRVLAVEAGATLLVERARLVAAADAHGVALLGVCGPEAAR